MTVENPDGSWAYYQYDSSSGLRTSGLKIREVRPFLDSTLAEYLSYLNSEPGSSDTAHTFEYSYSPHAETDDTGDCQPTSPRTLTEMIGGVVVAKTYHVYYYDTPSESATSDWYEIEQRDADPRDATGFDTASNSPNPTTTTHYYGYYGAIHPLYIPAQEGRPWSIQHPDGQTISYSYTRGTFDSSTLPGTFTGTGANTDVQVLETGGRTYHETITSAAGKILRTMESTPEGKFFNWTVYAYESGGQGRLEHEYHLNGTQRDLSWSGCCALASDRDATGIYTTYDPPDDLGRITAKNKWAADEQSYKRWEYDYDALGRIDEERVKYSSDTLTTTRSYWLDGHLHTITDPANLTTSYAYESTAVTAAGQRVTVTRPDGGTEVTDYYRDGRVKSITGTGAVARYFQYEYSNTGEATQCTIEYGPTVQGQSVETKTVTDALGRTKQVEKPVFNSTEHFVTTYEYYTANTTGRCKGRLWRITPSSGQAPTVYEYDDYGDVSRTGLDVDDNGLVNASMDRITETATTYDHLAPGTGDLWTATDLWRIVTQKVYHQDNSDATLQTVEAQWLSTTDGQGSGSFTGTTVSIDMLSNRTVTTTTVNRGLKQVQVSVRYPDSTTQEISTSINGLLTSRQSKTGRTTGYEYDGFERQWKVTDPRTGVTETHYNSLGQVESVTDADSPANQTTYEYYANAEAGAGRVKSVTAPNGKKQYFAYTLRGEQWRTWGDTPYPVEYAYDDYGRKTQMHTYRGGTGWNGASWPGSPGTPDVTTWVYDPYTGLLAGKLDAASQGATYTYSPAGRMDTRTWARTVNEAPIVTSYLYSSTTGELTDVQYRINNQPDPLTPDVSFTYTRTGQQKTVTDVVGTRTFYYRYEDENVPAGEKDLQPWKEDIVAGVNGLYSQTLTRAYQTATNGLLGRPAGFSIGEDYTVGYAYDTVARLNNVTGPGLPETDGVTYERLTDSELIWKTNFGAGTPPPAQIVRTYEPYRDILLSVANYRSGSGTAVSSYDYTRDAQNHGADSVGRRTKLLYAGTAFGYGPTPVAPPARTDWGYNDRNEVTSAVSYLTTQGQELYQRRRAYANDPIGNRASRTESTGNPLYYCANAVNEYTATDDAAGCSPPVTESFAYDDDGNMTSTGSSTYTWDAENRLHSATPTAPINNVSKKVELKYDYLGRRVEKKVWTYTAGAWPEDPGAIERYVYDGWNVVLTLNGLSSNAITRKSTWGLDLSGTLHGAAGIGGLLANAEWSGSAWNAYWFFYDGNGNVTEVIQPPTGTVIQDSLIGGGGTEESLSDLSADEAFTAFGLLIDLAADDLLGESVLAGGGGGGGPPSWILAHYEYDPYGNVLYSYGSYASVNPFRFSTKWYDTESALYYYGHRYYSPRLGRCVDAGLNRWRNRLNAYEYRGNRPVTRPDRRTTRRRSAGGGEPPQRDFDPLKRLTSPPESQHLLDDDCADSDDDFTVFQGCELNPIIPPPRPCDATRGFPPQLEPWFANNGAWCKDTSWTQSQHGSTSEVHCYREVTAPSFGTTWIISGAFGGTTYACPHSRHVCFRQSTGDCEQEHYDRVGSCEGKNADGTCNFQVCCWLAKVSGGNQWRPGPNDPWQSAP